MIRTRRCVTPKAIGPNKHGRRFVRGVLGFVLALLAGTEALGDGPPSPTPMRPSLLGVDPEIFEVGSIESVTTPQPDPGEDAPPQAQNELERAARTVGLFAAVSLAPVAVLMTTAFVRINVVLLLLRQALGSPLIPGNQVITVLSLLLTAMVMAPAAETVFRTAIRPYADGELPAQEAWKIGSEPVKSFMLEQIARTGHEHYLVALDAHAGDRAPASDSTEWPLRIVAPAFLISELTTALWIGFVIYLPFLVIDLAVSAVLAATGLIMLPPAQVALPLKLGLFVLADGWWLVADALLRTFTLGSSGIG